MSRASTTAPSRSSSPSARRDAVGLGLDVGGTKILGLAVSASGIVLCERRRDTPAQGDELLEALADLATELSNAVETGSGQVAGLGVGVPGLVDIDGVLRFAPNLLGANGTPVRSGLTELLGGRWPVAVDNDATCAAAGERAFGAGRGSDDVLFVTVGTGVGGGVVSGGQLLRGAHNFAGEIGHMTVDPQGPPCPCGKRGCWERYASGSGLGRLAREAADAGHASAVLALAGGDPDAIRGEHVVAAAEGGDADAGAVLSEFAWWLGLGLANLANVLDPGLIVLGGGLVAVLETLLDPVRASFAAWVERADQRTDVRIVPATLGERGGAAGAAVNGIEAAGYKVDNGGRGVDVGQAGPGTLD